MRLGSLLPLVVVTAALSTSTVARAQGNNQAAAEALFDEGKKLMTAGSYAQACPKFAESQKLDPGPGTLLNLAACWEKAGKTATAWVTYKETITEAEKSNRKEWAAQATKRAKALEPILSKLTIAVPENVKVSGLTVKRDGVVLGSAEYGLAIPQDPGKHVIEASAPDKKTFSTTVELGAKSDMQTVTITPLEDSKGAVAATGPATTPSTTPNQGSSSTTSSPSGGDYGVDTGGGGGTLRIVGLVVAGVGVVGIGAGAYFGLHASGLNEDAKSNCNADQTRCNAEGLKQVDDAKSAATISTIGFIAGGALLVGGAVLFFVGGKSGSKTAKHTTVVPVASAGGGGLFLNGTF